MIEFDVKFTVEPRGQDKNMIEPDLRNLVQEHLFEMYSKLENYGFVMQHKIELKEY